MGVLMFCTLFFLTFTIITFFEVIIKLLSLLKTGIESLIEYVKHKPTQNTIKNIMNDVFDAEEEAIRNNYNRQLLNDEKILQRVKYLKSVYPYCDRNLFDEYQNNFMLLQRSQIIELESRMKESHDIAIETKQLNIDYISYTDINDYNKIETININTIQMNLYYTKEVYILAIKHTGTFEMIAYKSKRKATLLQLCNDIYNYVEKHHIALSIQDMYNEKDYADIEIIK